MQAIIYISTYDKFDFQWAGSRRIIKTTQATIAGTNAASAMRSISDTLSLSDMPSFYNLGNKLEARRV